ncbi:methyltransferase domain-containing protein [Aeromonas schubertii]|uniref:Methyltransferase domain-containing protein n=1 Tax=Aeromonas schubertii TaxID=652 RepID=A0ABS7VG71_9GAMM|nr:class I SAM-dependent methyltransferase [Aeromonas schubertii]MBZ6068041.1 methyltransferase domain-containing protein [Aeromonas schubertii]
MEYICPHCSSNVELYFHLDNSPILQNVLYDSESEAITCNRIAVDFYYCNSCCYLFNPSFREDDIAYDARYNNDQMSSPYYREYLSGLADKLISECSLGESSSVLEIGCGSGYFLKLLIDKVKVTKVCGFDPAYDGQYGLSNIIHKEYFSKSETKYNLVILRHCFDSFINSPNLIDSIRDSITDDGVIYIEYPALEYIIDAGDFSMLYHECHSYYSLLSITGLLKNFNLKVDSVFHLFNGQYSGVICSKLNTGVFDCSEILKIINEYKNILIWGVSGRAVTLMNHLCLNKDIVKFGVDVNINKQGRYIPGTGQRIISPADAVSLSPELVIISNYNYLDEIMSNFDSNVHFVTFDGQLHVK